MEDYSPSPIPRRSQETGEIEFWCSEKEAELPLLPRRQCGVTYKQRDNGACHAFWWGPGWSRQDFHVMEVCDK